MKHNSYKIRNPLLNITQNIYTDKLDYIKGFSIEQFNRNLNQINSEHSSGAKHMIHRNQPSSPLRHPRNIYKSEIGKLNAAEDPL